MDFAFTDVVDEILVVNNNAAAGTSEEVEAAAAHLPDGSSVTGDTRKAVLLGLWMIGLVIRYRLRSWLGR